MRYRFVWFLTLAAVVLSTAGCGSFIAHRIVQALNTYHPTWVYAPALPVFLWASVRVLPNLPCIFRHWSGWRPKMRYRIVEPADYNLEVTATTIV